MPTTKKSISRAAFIVMSMCVISGVMLNVTVSWCAAAIGPPVRGGDKNGRMQINDGWLENLTEYRSAVGIHYHLLMYPIPADSSIHDKSYQDWPDVDPFPEDLFPLTDRYHHVVHEADPKILEFQASGYGWPLVCLWSKERLVQYNKDDTQIDQSEEWQQQFTCRLPFGIRGGRAVLPILPDIRPLLINTFFYGFCIAISIQMWRKTIRRFRIVHNRCRNCGYDRSGSWASTCPECGCQCDYPDNVETNTVPR